MSTRQRLPARRPEAPPEAEAEADEAERSGTPVYRIGPVDSASPRIELPISPEARAEMEENKRLLALASDRELLRHALSLQRWAVDVLRGGRRVFVTDAEGRIEAEMRVDPVHRPGTEEVILDLAPRRRGE
jgi:hypothetical protein